MTSIGPAAARGIAGPSRRRRWMASLALIALYYTFLLTDAKFVPWITTPGLGFTFNSMLEHLLQGRFDVSPDVVGSEGFLRDGRVYAYWGIFGALLRVPLLLVPGGMDLDITRLSILTAVMVGAIAKLVTLRLVCFERAEGEQKLLFWATSGAMLLGGASIAYLKSSLYQEVSSWGSALGAVFVYLAVRGLVRARFTPRQLGAMAVIAGLALWCRVSMGAGLFAALGLLLIVLAVRERRERKNRTNATPVAPAPPSASHYVLPLAVLLAFAGVAGYVNQQRWGNPLVFANYEYSLHNGLHPDRWPRAQRYGLFNLVRVPLGLEYYLAPIWAVRRSGDRLWLESSHQRLLDSAELPPASFLWTDPLPIALGLVALRMSWRPRQAVPTDRPAAAAIAIGLMVPAVLMLSAISMTHRYRADFYPLLDFAAFLGCYLLIGPRAPALARRRSGRWIVALALLGIIASHITLVLYKASNFGNGSKRLRSGIVAYYREQLAERLPWLTRAAP